jgi:hypothetical protein
MSSKLYRCNEARISLVESKGAPSDAEDFEDNHSELSYFNPPLTIEGPQGVGSVVKSD